MKKEERFKIIFGISMLMFNRGEGDDMRLVRVGETRILSTMWDNKEGCYEPGDCYIRAIKSKTNPKRVPMNWYDYHKELPSAGSLSQLSPSMTLKQIVLYVYNNKHLLGVRGDKLRCLGICLLDGAGEEIRKKDLINFPVPIMNFG